jgi:hypothetical protein
MPEEMCPEIGGGVSTEGGKWRAGEISKGE